MKAKYAVIIRYNGTWKYYYFESRKEAFDFMYKQEIKGCRKRDMEFKVLNKQIILSRE